ncbi:hypothetical protein [Promicromonospora soli]
MDFTEAELDAVLEDIAKDKHFGTPAADAHHTIATQMWGHVKALEYTTGRLLVFGQDAELLAGAPPGTPRTLEGPTIVGVEGTGVMSREIEDPVVLVTDLPGDVPWPHRTLNLEPANINDLDGADVVIANLPLADVRTLTRARQVDITKPHHELIRRALDWLRPGGLLIALAHCQLLEGTDARPRHSIAMHADLIAAARLPANALRRAPLLDSPVDLLMLRRREPGHQPSGLEFIGRSPVRIEEHPPMLINDCYATAPWNVLGNIVPDPIEPGLTTAAPLSGHFGVRLGDVLHDQTNHAIDLACTPRNAPRSHPGPARNHQEERSVPPTQTPTGPRCSTEPVLTEHDQARLCRERREARHARHELRPSHACRALARAHPWHPRDEPRS